LHIRKAAALCLTICATVAPSASAQMKWTDQGFANISIGGQAGSHTLATSTSFDLYDEQAQVETTQKVKGGVLFDLNGGYKVWRNLVAAIGYSRTSSKGDASVAASIPDPDRFDRLRAVTASAPNLKHTEQAINLMGVWMVPVTDKIDVGASFGPSIFTVKQDIPSTLTIAEPGPTVSGLATNSAKKTVAGINLGVDVTYLVTKQYGVGGFLRYTWGSADLDGATKSLTVGGLQIGVGARYRF
jgi:outer membrane protein with beta-barrel domain